MKLAPTVSNEKEVKTLLDYVNWKLLVYTCEKSFCNNISIQPYCFHSLCSPNASCCWSNSYEAAVSFRRRCNNSNCSDFLRTSVISHWYIFFILGLFCLSGNFVVIYQKINSFCKNRNQQKNILIYNILVLNLSIANLLMGIYLITISLEIRHKLEKNIYFSNHSFCNTLGVISTVSTQTSISILSIISFYRLVSVMLPYKKIHLRVVVGTAISTWLIWLIVAFLPSIPVEPLNTMFTFGISKTRNIAMGTLKTFEITTQLIENLKSLFSTDKFEEIDIVLKKICEYRTKSVFTKLYERFGWIDLNMENFFYVGYYDANYICTANLFFDSLYLNHYFSFSLVAFNLVASFAILIAHAFIALVVSGNEKIACFLFRWCKEKKIKSATFIKNTA